MVRTMTKPLIGIASTWNEFSPCQANLKQVADHVKQGIRAAGGVPDVVTPAIGRLSAVLKATLLLLPAAVLLVKFVFAGAYTTLIVWLPTVSDESAIDALPSASTGMSSPRSIEASRHAPVTLPMAARRPAFMP